MFSALVIQDLAATIERLHQPRLAGRPLVIVAGQHHLKALATDERARQAGVRVGDNRAQAQLHCPEAVILRARDEVYRRLFADVTAELARCIDKVEPCYQPGRAWWLVASDHPGELDILRRRIECLLGGSVAIGTGSGKFVAQAAGAGGVDCRVAPGEEAAFLAPLPGRAAAPERRYGAAAADDRHPQYWRFRGAFAGGPSSNSGSGRAAFVMTWRGASTGVRCKACQPPPTLEGALSFEDPLTDRESLLAACLALARNLLRQLKEREAGAPGFAAGR